MTQRPPSRLNLQPILCTSTRGVVVGGHIVILSPLFAYITSYFSSISCRLVSLIALKDLLGRFPYSRTFLTEALG